MKILLTGANGYIGRRLLPLLLHAGHEVTCLVRDVRRMDMEKMPVGKVRFIEGDLLKLKSLENIPDDIEIAYYLVHSMGYSYDNFKEMEQITASNFVQRLSSTKCRQIIYLGGIANDTSLSEHLYSRKSVESLLSSSHIPLTVLRAAIIIGSGGASFEIIRDLVEKLPVMVAPKWILTLCQPIAVRDVLAYLIACMDNQALFGKTFDISGPDVLTYKEMMLQFAKVRGLNRWIITVPVLTPRLSSLWLYFVTTTSFSLARSLVDSMKNEVIKKQDGIEKIIPLTLTGYKEAVSLAFDKIRQNEVISSWKDALASSSIDTRLMQYIQVPQYGCFVDYRKKSLGKRAKNEVVDNIWSVGGDRGWYYMNFLWKIRGYLDKLVGGVGLRRGRRSPSQLVPGDALDFWRVLMADKEESRLLLYAEMKLPGEAWLEFKISQQDGQDYLEQTATFRPHGIWGRLYWYSIVPLHALIFPGLARSIIRYKSQ